MDLIFIALTLAALGAVCASFTGVVAGRVHTGQSWVRGRSRCDSCRNNLDVRDLIPILSWVVWGGRCRQCRARVSIEYAMWEALLAISFVWSYFHFGLSIVLPVFLCALVVILYMVLYDLRHTVVPAGSSEVLIVLGTIVAFLTAPDLHTLGSQFLIAGGIAAFFYLIHVLSHGKAMGLGDAPVALGLSLLVGTQALAGVLFSFWIGALCGIVVLSTRRGGPRMGIEVPFVPFLAIGYLLAFFTAWNPLTFIPG